MQRLLPHGIALALLVSAFLPLTSIASPPNGASAMSLVPADLYLTVEDSGLSTPECNGSGESVSISIEVGPTSVAVVAGQFLVQYDPTCLDFTAAAPGRSCDPQSPFTGAVSLIVDEAAGTVFYAVLVPPSGTAINGPVTFACLTFARVAECTTCDLCFGTGGVQSTLLSDRLGQPVPFIAHCSEPIDGFPNVVEACPADANVEVSCNHKTAMVTWSPPIMLDGCDGPLPLNCTAAHNGGANVSGLIQTGGLFPLGITNICCTSESSCDTKVACCWTVTVATGGGRCNDGDDCTVDVCDPESPNAEPDGCLHFGDYHPNGDAFPPPNGDGLVNLDDILCILDGFELASACPGGDIAPCGGDGEIEIADLIAVLDAFSSSNECPCPD